MREKNRRRLTQYEDFRSNTKTASISWFNEELPVQTIQQIVHDIADHLPEQATWDDVLYTVYVRQKIEEGLKDIEEDRTVSHEEAVQELLGKSKA